MDVTALDKYSSGDLLYKTREMDHLSLSQRTCRKDWLVLLMINYHQFYSHLKLF